MQNEYRSKKAASACWASVFMVLMVGGCVTVPFDSEIEHPPLWQIEKPDGSIMWLLGTVHWLPAAQQPDHWRLEIWLRHRRVNTGQPLPVPWNHGSVHTAIENMQSLVIESIDQPTEAELLEVVSRVFVTDECSDSSRSNPDSWRENLMTENDSIPLIGKLFLMNESRSNPVQEADNVGLEYWLGTFAGLRGVPVFALENLETRAHVVWANLGHKSCEIQAALMAQFEAVQSEPRESQPELPRAYALWRVGDIATLDQELRRFDRDDPELFRALVSGRNRFCIDFLLEHLDRPGNTLVAVGMAHLAGPDNLLQLLAEHDIEARRVQ